MVDGSTGCSGCHPQPPAPPCFAANDSDVVMFTFSLFSCIAAAVFFSSNWLHGYIHALRRLDMLKCFVVKR